jgi:hypothetical protein
MSDKLSIRLDARIDEDGNKFYIGRLNGPFTINCEDGVVFLVFTSQEGLEELQIGHSNKSSNNDKKFKFKAERYEK